MANIITGIRIVISAVLMFCRVLSPAFFVLYIWIAVIAMIKVTNIAAGYIRQKEFISVHSIINRVTGGLLFVFPLSLAFIDPRYRAVVVCMAATVAAVYEEYLIQAGRTT